MKKLIVLVGVLGMFALGSGVANAHMNEAQLGARAFLENNGDLHYRFWYDCPSGEDFVAVIRVRQGTESVVIGGPGTCSGFSGGFVTFYDTPFHVGPARSSMRFEFEDNNVFTDSRDIRIRPCC